MISALALTVALLAPAGHPDPGNSGYGSGDDTCSRSCGWFSPSFEKSPVNVVFCTVPQACPR